MGYAGNWEPSHIIPTAVALSTKKVGWPATVRRNSSFLTPSALYRRRVLTLEVLRIWTITLATRCTLALGRYSSPPWADPRVLSIALSRGSDSTKSCSSPLNSDPTGVRLVNHAHPHPTQPYLARPGKPYLTKRIETTSCSATGSLVRP